MVKPPSPSESAIVVHLPKISKGIEDSSKKMEDLQLEFLSLKKIFEDSFSSTSMIGKTSDSLKKMVSFITKKETIESIKPAKKVESETTTKKLPFKSEVSKPSSDGLNFSKDFFNHLLKGFDNFFEDITTIFGFNFGKYFKDGLKQLFTGKGILGGIIFGPFKIALKSISLILSGIKGVVGGLLGGIKSLSGNLLKKGVSAVTGVGKSIIDKGKTGVKNALIKPLFQTAGFSDFIENKESQDESEKINLKIQTLRNKLAENELKQETALGQEKFDLMVEAKELEQQEVGLIRRRVKLKSDQLQKEIDFFNQKESDLLSKGEFEQARMTREESDRLIVKQSDLVSSDISPGDSLSETELVTKKSESRIENFISKILEFRSGTKGVLGQLFADFGEGTMTILHGKEAVVPENSVEGRILKDFESGKLNNFREVKDIEVIKPSTNSRSVRGIQNILDDEDSKPSTNSRSVRGIQNILDDEDSSEFFDLNITNLIEIGESLKDISEKLDKIVNMNKEDSDRNEQLAESNISRRNLLDRVKKKSVDSDDSEKNEKSKDKKSPFSFLGFLGNIFSGIFGLAKNILPWLVKGIAILGIVKLLKSLFIDKDWDVLSESFVDSITKFTQKLLQAGGKLIDFVNSLSGAPKVPKGVPGVGKITDPSTSSTDPPISSPNATGATKLTSSLLIEAESLGRNAFNKNFDATFERAIATGFDDDAARNIAKEVAEESSEKAVEKFLKGLSKKALDADNIGDIGKAVSDVTSSISQDFLKNAVVADPAPTPSTFSKLLDKSSKLLSAARIASFFIDPTLAALNVKRRSDAGQDVGKAAIAETAGVIGNFGGGWAGMKGGAYLGGALGTAILPGVGTGIGTFTGGTIGLLGGSMLTGTVTEMAADFLLGNKEKFKSVEQSIVERVWNWFTGDEKKSKENVKNAKESKETVENVKESKEIAKNVKETEENNLKTSKIGKEVSEKMKNANKNVNDAAKEVEKQTEKFKSGFGISNIFETLKNTISDAFSFITGDKNKKAFIEGMDKSKKALEGLTKGGINAFIEAFETGDLFGTGKKYMDKFMNKSSNVKENVKKMLSSKEQGENGEKPQDEFNLLKNLFFPDDVSKKINKDSDLSEAVSPTLPAAGDFVMSILGSEQAKMNLSQRSPQTNVIDASVKQFSNSPNSSTTIISAGESCGRKDYIISQRNHYA